MALYGHVIRDQGICQGSNSDCWFFRALDRACLFFYGISIFRPFPSVIPSGFICCALPLWIFAVTPSGSVLSMEALEKSALCEHNNDAGA